MRLQGLVVIFFTFVAPAAAQPRCDPITQYEQNGGCCKLCPPGTSMTSLGSCLEPQCPACQSGDYQEKYTKEAKCLRQQYCDPNKNFQIPVHDPKKRTACSCREGFHCSSLECITCVAHQACQPGYGVKLMGNHSKDTVCEKCAEGTFSGNNSRTDVCQKWTECQSGQKVLQAGSDTSDRICGDQTRTHAVTISLALTFGLLLLLVLGCLLIGKRHCAHRKVKMGIEHCMAEKKDVPKENKALVPNANDAANEATLCEWQHSQDEPRTPEEVDDDLSQEICITTEIHLTDKGKFVMQDKGMKEMKSEEEA